MGTMVVEQQLKKISMGELIYFCHPPLGNVKTYFEIRAFV